MPTEDVPPNSCNYIGECDCLMWGFWQALKVEVGRVGDEALERRKKEYLHTHIRLDGVWETRHFEVRRERRGLYGSSVLYSLESALGIIFVRNKFGANIDNRIKMSL